MNTQWIADWQTRRLTQVGLAPVLWQIHVSNMARLARHPDAIISKHRCSVMIRAGRDLDPLGECSKSTPSQLRQMLFDAYGFAIWHVRILLKSGKLVNFSFNYLAIEASN